MENPSQRAWKVSLGHHNEQPISIPKVKELEITSSPRLIPYLYTLLSHHQNHRQSHRRHLRRHRPHPQRH